MKKKILVVFGTRPEAIKMASIIKEFQKYKDIFEVKICVTAQHREMLDHVLNIFNIVPDFDLNIMKKNQDLYDISSNILIKMKNILSIYKPDLVIVHGDTTTTSITALAAFYQKIKVAHIEAGLRTWNLYSPWPEEANRQITAILTEYHFAPTERNKKNLLKENKKESKIYVTGNTVIDSLFMALNKIEKDKKLKRNLQNIFHKLNINLNSKIILVTGHRRENFGEGFINICEALKEIAIRYSDIEIIYPVHLNPNVRRPVNKILNNINNIKLIEPLGYLEFIYLMNKSYIILTDSGGIQEEAPSLGKPVLVMRETTERQEAIEAGTVKLIGTDKEKIIKETIKLLINKKEYTKMSKACNPYGDGKAAERIVKILKEKI